MIVTKTNNTSSSADKMSEAPANVLSAHSLAVQGGVLTNWGTMGCCLTLNQHLYGLTNYHVLFGEHTPEYVHKHLAGTLEVFCKPREKGPFLGRATHFFNSLLDYALFELTPDFSQAALFSLGEPIEPSVGMCVHKTGAVTGLTHGIIDASSCLDRGVVFIRPNEEKTTEKLCDYGDSGSVWLYDDGSPHPRPTALHRGINSRDPHMGRAQTVSSLLIDIQTILLP